MGSQGPQALATRDDCLHGVDEVAFTAYTFVYSRHVDTIFGKMTVGVVLISQVIYSHTSSSKHRDGKG